MCVCARAGDPRAPRCTKGPEKTLCLGLKLGWTEGSLVWRSQLLKVQRTVLTTSDIPKPVCERLVKLADWAGPAGLIFLSSLFFHPHFMPSHLSFLRLSFLPQSAFLWVSCSLLRLSPSPLGTCVPPRSTLAGERMLSWRMNPGQFCPPSNPFIRVDDRRVTPADPQHSFATIPPFPSFPSNIGRSYTFEGGGNIAVSMAMSLIGRR